MKKLTFAELSRKREDGRNACERLDSVIEFLYKYIEASSKIINIKYERAIWKRFREIHNVETYALRLWCDLNQEYLYAKSKSLGLEVL